MKKAWQQPSLEVLDVKMTMWNISGSNFDGSWTEHIPNTQPNPNPTPDNPGPLVGGIMS